MKTWALAVAAAVASGQEFQCAVPNAFPQTSTVQRGFWDFLATLRFSAQSFVQTQGFCRFGTSWNRQPRLETNMGEAHSAQNNAYGGNLWFCLEEPRTQLGCVAECEARYMCAAADRPPNPGPEECCLFYRNNTGDNQPDRECFVRKRLDVEELPAGSFVNTEVKVTPIPFLSYLTLHSDTTGVMATAEMGLCPMWTWCGFVVKDCHGDLLYEVRVEHVPDVNHEGVQLLGTTVPVYIFHDNQGTVIGRTNNLGHGGEPIRIFPADGGEVALMITAAGWFHRVFWNEKWFVNSNLPGAAVASYPVLDPRLLTFTVAFQYRNLGYLGTFWVLLLVLFLIGLCLYVRKVKYGGWDCRAWDCCRPGGWCGCCSGLVDRIYSWREVMLYGEPEYQQQDASCCTGRGKTPKSDTKTMWKDEQESLLLVRGPMP
mmetsp:Transcript_83036/g.199284  ORF Transcript_83036/g.199284 Transcript_83036/m.199284 type:complete len:428 (+) Transcript_83036:55-1338(+)